MNKLICPDIFDGNITAFFTRKSLGVDVEKISSILSINKENIYLPIQKHTDRVAVLHTELGPRIADAIVTKRTGILLGVQVADCVPILLFDRKKTIIGAVHAGWRGTAAQIVKKTITTMVDHFSSSPEEIIMALGPSIRGDCYSVDHEVKDAVFKATGEGEYYLLQKDGKYCIDLSSANIFQAISSGVLQENIWCSRECTYCNPDSYYSYRYSKMYNGSQGGFIGIL
ncbi:MAG: peptidoglycan editing factor PgeF [Nitrospirota bacterium]